MTQEFFVRIDMDVPGASPIAHIAELHSTNDPQVCTTHRIIELTDTHTITGLADLDHARDYGMNTLPQRQVPHPDSYADLSDCKTTFLNKAEFEQLWAKALQQFPEF